MPPPILFILSGLPATGKSTLAKLLAKEYNAAYLRIDTIEQALLDLCNFEVEGEGYLLACRMATDNLKIGCNVVADSCNPINVTRRQWEDIAIQCQSRYVNIEVICSDEAEHKQRCENRHSEIAGLRLPTWEEILNRQYDVWEAPIITIDTANKSIEACVDELKRKIEFQTRSYSAL